MNMIVGFDNPLVVTGAAALLGYTVSGNLVGSALAVGAGSYFDVLGMNEMTKSLGINIPLYDGTVTAPGEVDDPDTGNNDDDDTVVIDPDDPFYVPPFVDPIDDAPVIVIPPDTGEVPVDPGDSLTDADVAYNTAYSQFHTMSPNYDSANPVLVARTNVQLGDNSSSRVLGFFIIAGLTEKTISIDKFATLVARGTPVVMYSGNSGFNEAQADVACRDNYSLGFFDSLAYLGNGNAGVSTSAVSVPFSKSFDGSAVYAGLLPVINRDGASSASNKGVTARIFDLTKASTTRISRTYFAPWGSQGPQYYFIKNREVWNFQLTLSAGTIIDNAVHSEIFMDDLMRRLWAGQTFHLATDFAEMYWDITGRVQTEAIAGSNGERKYGTAVLEDPTDLDAAFAEAVGFSLNDLGSKMVLWANSQSMRDAYMNQRAVTVVGQLAIIVNNVS